VSSEQRSAEREEVCLAVSDPSQLSSLREWLRGTPQLAVQLTPGRPGPGEQGAVDVLTVLASSTGLVAAIRMLPEFIRSRRSGFRIDATVRGQKFELTATNSEDLLEVIERLLGE
jgi:hypothetical protein